MTPEARKLADSWGGVWAEHHEHLVEDWQREVANNETRASYWDWVISEIEIHGDMQQ